MEAWYESDAPLAGGRPMLYSDGETLVDYRPADPGFEAVGYVLETRAEPRGDGYAYLAKARLHPQDPPKKILPPAKIRQEVGGRCAMECRHWVSEGDRVWLRSGELVPWGRAGDPPFGTAAAVRPMPDPDPSENSRGRSPGTRAPTYEVEVERDLLGPAARAVAESGGLGGPADPRARRMARDARIAALERELERLRKERADDVSAPGEEGGRWEMMR